MSGVRRKVEPISRLKIREIATLLRELVGNKDGYLDIVGVLEFTLPKFINDFEYEFRTEQEMGSNLGLTIPDKNIIFLREDVYDGAVVGDGHHRMTVAHEIGHLLLHKNIPSSFARIDPKESIPAYNCSEWQANCFGGELLVPHKGLTINDDPTSVSRRYGVTRKAAEIQLSKK